MLQFSPEGGIMIRLLVVDDHTSFRESLVFMLDMVDDLSVVAQAGSVDEARAAIASHPVDVALLDLDLAGERGLDIVPLLRMHHPAAVAVILTANTGARSRAMAVAAGAAGVMHKTAGLQDVVDTVRRAHTGEPLISPREAAGLRVEGAAQQVNEVEGRRALRELSAREQDVLRALATGLDNKGIADRLFISQETARSHIARIYRKLGVESRLQAVTFAVRHGFLTDDDLE
jgi:DNA-binding NarL/FixJ family response regulator